MLRERMGVQIHPWTAQVIKNDEKDGLMLLTFVLDISGSKFMGKLQTRS